MTSRRLLGWAVMIGLGGILAAIGCSATVDPGEDDGASTGGGGTSTTSTGGMGGMGGMEIVWPCGVDCSEITTDQCHEVICNEAAGMCEVVSLTNGTVCDDGQFCTINDTCQEGSCVGGGQNDCGMAAPECNAVACDEMAATCSLVAADEGASCQPADLCIVGASCLSGSCVGGMANDCFFAPVPDDCHVAVCDPMSGVCVPQPGNEGQPCIDLAALCDVGKTCAAGVCQGGGPLDCSALTMGCFDGQCDPMSGQCTQVPIMPGNQCAEATDECNVGICDMMGMCNPQPANEGMMCDTDGCFVGQTCATGTCQGGTQITQCMNGDNCCPAGCTLVNDDDCGCDFGLISNESQLADPIITGLIIAQGNTVANHNNNNTGTHTENMALLNQYDAIIFHEHDRLISATEMNNLTAWVQAGGSLLVTGYDSLGSPTDPNLASVVNCVGPGDGPFSSAMVVTNAVHPILQGPAQAFPFNTNLTAGSTDHDQCGPGTGALQLITIGGTSSKLLVTNNVGAGLVIYWNGNGSTSGPLVDWLGSAGSQPDLTNLFVNVIDHMCHP